MPEVDATFAAHVTVRMSGAATVIFDAAAARKERLRRCRRSSAEARSPNAAENLLVALFEPVRHEHPLLSGAEGLVPFDNPVLDVVVAPPTPTKPPPVELLLLLLALPPLLAMAPPRQHRCSVEC